MSGPLEERQQEWRRMLSHGRLVCMWGILLWHAGGCGMNNFCFPRGLTPVATASLWWSPSGLLACVPKILGTTALPGFMLLSGLACRGKSLKARHAAEPFLVGLFFQLVVDPVLTTLVPGAKASIPGAAHVWYLYSLALARSLHFICAKMNLMETTTQRTRYTLVSLSLVWSLLVSHLWPRVVKLSPADSYVATTFFPGARVGAFDGETWSSSEWFDSIGVRCFTFLFFYVLGTAIDPENVMYLNTTCSDTFSFFSRKKKRTTSLKDADSSSSSSEDEDETSKMLLRLLSLASVGLGILYYNLFRLDVRDNTLFVSGGSLEAALRQLELMSVGVVSPLFLLALSPKTVLVERVLSHWTTKSAAMGCYLCHPIILRLFGKPLLLSVLATLSNIADCHWLSAFSVMAGLAAIFGVVTSIQIFLCEIFSFLFQQKQRKFVLVVGGTLLLILRLLLPPATTPALYSSPIIDNRRSTLLVRQKFNRTTTIVTKNATKDKFFETRHGDLYVCAAQPTEVLGESPLITRIKVVATDLEDLENIHHISLYQCDDDRVSFPANFYESFDCTSRPMWPKCEEMVYVWNSNGENDPLTFRLPKGFALEITSKIFMIQVHHIRVLGDPKTAASRSVGFDVDTVAKNNLQIVQYLELGPRLPTMLRIPPQMPKYVSRHYCASPCVDAARRISPNLTIFALEHHMHRAGIAMTTTIRRQKKTIPILSTSPFDMRKDATMTVLSEPMTLQDGDFIEATCVYDTRGRNETTHLGVSTTDEMCFSYILITKTPGFGSCWHADLTLLRPDLFSPHVFNKMSGGQEDRGLIENVALNSPAHNNVAVCRGLGYYLHVKGTDITARPFSLPDEEENNPFSSSS